MTANQFDKKTEAWSALFSEPMSELVQRYTSSVAFDRRLWRADIAGSLAHAAMLAAQGVISAADLGAIKRGLATIADEIERGAFEWRSELEDVHLNIEARLVQLAGDAGKRLHTGRSRNDQVATDVRLWLRDEITGIGSLLAELQRALVELADQHTETILPGFTHLQVAQPVSFAHHLLAYVEMFARDAERMAEVHARTNRLPLGAAALAGTSYPLDREMVAKALGMTGICRNSIDAVSDRDFAIEFTRRGEPVHGSRLALQRGAGALDEPELRLRRARRPLLHRLVDHAAEEEPRRARAGARQDRPRRRPPDGPADPDEGPAAGLQQGQPGRQGAAVRHGRHRQGHAAHLLRAGAGHHVKAEAMERAAARGYATATDLADYLVRKGVPFRDAHEVVAHAVKHAIQAGVGLADLPLATLQGFHPGIASDVHGVLTLRGSLASRKVAGGTAPEQVRAEIARHRARLGK